MLTKDTALQARHEQELLREAKQDKINLIIAAESARDKEIEQFGYGDPERQKGRMLHPWELEAMIKSILPGEDRVHFLHNPLNHTKKCIYIKGDDGNHWFAGAYENSLMPERSIMQIKEVEVLDPNATTVTTTDIDFHDAGGNLVHIPKGTTVPFMVRGRESESKKIKVEWGMELVRGWRTVGRMLLSREIISLTAFERVFGYTDDEVWAAGVKKVAGAQSPF